MITSNYCSLLFPQVAWRILGPNSREPLPLLNTDIRGPVNGTFFFKDGELSTHTVELLILPHGEVEVEETFVIELNILSGEMDVDPQAGSIKLKVFHCIMTAKLFPPSLINQSTSCPKQVLDRTHSCPPNVFPLSDREVW